MAYSDGEIAEALIRLGINKYDFDLTAEQTSISKSTIKRWARNAPKKSVGDLLDRAIQRMLMVIPKNMNAKDWAIALGILMDKWLLMQGEPTERTESLVRGIKDLEPEERELVVEEAKKLIESLGAGSDSAGDEQSKTE